MNVLIVDDEPHPRKTLESLVGKFYPEAVIQSAGSVNEALGKIEETRPDLLLLDIQMPGKSGFDLLERAGEIDFPVIFVTAYDQFAIRAIKYSAADYLLKPVDREELEGAISRALKKHREQHPRESLRTLLENLSQNQPKKLAVPDMEGICFINVDDIIRCDSDGNYTQIFLRNGKKLLSSKTLGEYEELLPAELFFRVHRSHLINLSSITRYIRGEGGYAELSDGSRVEVSRRRKNEFLERLAGNR